MKFLMMSLCFLILANPQCSIGSFPSLYYSVPSYSIVMEDEVMLRTDTQDPNDLTVSIKVFDSKNVLVLEVTTCTTQQCLTDLSALPAGTYTVHLSTVKGFIYTEIIFVG